jgi:hypothetical protein
MMRSRTGILFRRACFCFRRVEDYEFMDFYGGIAEELNDIHVDTMIRSMSAHASGFPIKASDPSKRSDI